MSSYAAKDTTNIRLSMDSTAVGSRTSDLDEAPKHLSHPGDSRSSSLVGEAPSSPNPLHRPPPALRPHHVELPRCPYAAIDLARAALARHERTHPSSSLRVTHIADEDTHRPDELLRTMRQRKEYRQDMVLLYHDALRRIEQMERKREEGPVGLEEAFEELEKFAGGNVDLEDPRPISRQARYLRRLLCFWAAPTYEGVGLTYLAAWQVCAGRDLTRRERLMLE